LLVLVVLVSVQLLGLPKLVSTQPVLQSFSLLVLILLLPK
jgi:hypothetical protein